MFGLAGQGVSDLEVGLPAPEKRGGLFENTAGKL